MSESPNKLFSGAKGAVKRVPKWAYYVAGGVVIAGGIVYLRGGGAADDEQPLDSTGAVGYTDGAGGSTVAPGIVVPPIVTGGDGTTEINPAIPEIFGDVLQGVLERIPTPDDYLSIIAGAGSPVAGADPGGVVTAPTSPGTTTAPKPNPCTKLGAGFHCGDTVSDGKVTRKFSGAIGWKRESSGGTGVAHYVKYRIRYCSKVEIWQVFPNKPGNPWTKTHGQTASNIC